MPTYVLDASAFLAGVSLYFNGTMLIPEDVEGELEYGRGKRRLEETIIRGAVLASPSKQYVDVVRARMAEGSDQGLSSIDIGVVALALEHHGIVVSDDYGIQNICLAMDIPFQPVAEKGVESHWQWGYRCKGCRRWLDSPEPCNICGSPSVRKRRQGD